MKKNILSVILVAILLLSLSACGEKKTEGTGENTVSGVLESFTDGVVTIKSDEEGSPELAFPVKDATIECENMLAGDEVVVVYGGEIDGTDTTKAKVQKVIDDGKNTTKESTITGTVVSATTNTVQIQTNTGQQYTFGTLGAQQVYRNGILEGNWVTVTYVGNLNSTDTSGIRVIEIRDDDANVIAQEKKKMKIRAVDQKVYATAGVHVRKSYSTDSKVVGSLAQSASVERTGICENGWSRIVFKGTDAYVYGDYLSKTKPKAAAKPATTAGKKPGTPQTGKKGSSKPMKMQPVKEQPSNHKPTTEKATTEKATTEKATTENPTTEAPEPVKNTLTGIVEDAGTGSLTIDAEGTALTFVTGNAQHNYKNGIQRGNEVKITYTGTISGTDTGNAVVLTIEDTNSNDSAVITGTIDNATMNTVTVTTDDGINIIFALEGAKVNCENGIADGTPVSVTVDLEGAMAASNIFPATQIDDNKSHN